MKKYLIGYTVYFMEKDIIKNYIVGNHYFNILNLNEFTLEKIREEIAMKNNVDSNYVQFTFIQLLEE